MLEQNQGNSISGDLKCKNFLGEHASRPPPPPPPPRRDRLLRSIITFRLLRNFCQLLEKLWTTVEICICLPFCGFIFSVLSEIIQHAFAIISPYLVGNDGWYLDCVCFSTLFFYSSCKMVVTFRWYCIISSINLICCFVDFQGDISRRPRYEYFSV